MIEVKKIKIMFVLICIVIFFSYYEMTKQKAENVEELNIIIGIGCGIDDINKAGEIKYSLPISVITYENDVKSGSVVYTGRGKTIPLTRSDRQLKMSKRYFLGTERVYILDENFAQFGINPLLNVLFNNPEINDKGYFVICEGSSESVLKYKIKGYDSSIEYIDEQLKNLSAYNFFGDEYTLRKTYAKVAIKGKKLVLPYMKIQADGIKVTGVGIFNSDKLIKVLDIQESRQLNILRGNKSKGIISIRKNINQYLDFDAKCTRKVECKKIDDRYEFIINLNLRGNVINNTLYDSLTTSKEVVKLVKDNIKNQTKEKCDRFIKKMQSEYKVDCLELSGYAMAKYGRDEKIDWDKVVANSKIDVKIEVEFENFGRGQF